MFTSSARTDQISVSLSSFSEGKNVTMTSLKALLVWIFFLLIQRPATPCPLQFLLDHWYFIASAGMWLHRAAVGHFLQDRPAREGLIFFDARLTFFLGICEMATDPDPPNSGLGLLATSSRPGFSAKIDHCRLSVTVSLIMCWSVMCTLYMCL